MKKLRLKLIREKAVIGVYQSLLSSIDITDIKNYLDNDKAFDRNPEEYEACVDMIESTINKYDEYSTKITPALKTGWTIDRITKLELAILLIALHEADIKSNEKQVIINEGVELTKKYCDDDSYKFINGVLNTIIDGE